MIPFARMLQYGNNIVPRGIKKFVQAQTHFTVLTDDGVLMSYGTNNSGSAGTGTTSTDLMWYTSTLTNVIDIYQQGTNKSVAITGDGKIWYCGVFNQNPAGSPSMGTSPLTSYYDISDRIPISGLDVIDVVISYASLSFLMRDGKIYSTDAILGGTTITSTGYTGWRVSTPAYQFKNLFGPCDYDQYANTFEGLTSNGELYLIGGNQWKQVANTTTSTYSSWTRSANLYSYSKVDGRGTNFTMQLVSDTDTSFPNRLYYSGISGVVNVANVNNTVNMYAVTGGASPIKHIFVSAGGQYSIRDDGSMWGSGSQGQNPLLPNNAANVSTSKIRDTPLVSNVNDIVTVVSSPSNYTVHILYKINEKYRIFGLGRVYGATTYTWTEIDVPSSIN